MAVSVFLRQERVFCVYACMYRAALRTAFPLKSDQELDELVASTQSEPDSNNDGISSQRLHSLVRTSRGFTVRADFSLCDSQNAIHIFHICSYLYLCPLTETLRYLQKLLPPRQTKVS